MCKNVIDLGNSIPVMGGELPYGITFHLWKFISVMIMFIRRDYIVGYSYTFHMLKIASSYQSHLGWD